MGIGTMTRGEKAAIFLSKSYMTKSPLWSMIEGYDEIQFEVELVHFIQVSFILVNLIRLSNPRQYCGQ